MKIRIGIRKNLFYPLMVIVYTFIRKIDAIIIEKYNDFEESTILTLIMFLSEFIIGFYFYFYYSKKYTQENDSQLTRRKLIYNPNEFDIEIPDHFLKIYLLIIISSFFDFNAFMLQNSYYKIFNRISITLEMRTRSILTISNSFLCYYILNLKIYRHQKFSLTIIFTCLLVVIISEFIFENYIQEESGIKYLGLLSLLVISSILDSSVDIIEKYLMEVDYVNTFQLLMLEGLFGFIFTLIYSFIENPFKKLKYVDKPGLFLVCLLIFFITSGGRNIYRLLTNKFYSPMARTLTDSFLDPIFIAYYFFFDDDFRDSNDKRNYYYFFFNLLISFIIVFFGCVYNELFILFCFGLEHETYDQISQRAFLTNPRQELPSLSDILDE